MMEIMLVILLLCFGNVVAVDFPQFTAHRIDNFGRNVGQTALADVDRDGDLDWIAGNAMLLGTGRRGNLLVGIRGGGQGTRHALGKGNTDVGGAAHDVDGDGWVDFVAGTKLLLNSREPKTKEFAAYEIGTIHSHDTEFADVNGDGKMDLIANSDKAGLFWYEIPRVVTNAWIAHRIASIEEHKVHGGVSPRAVADLDGDGDNDVVTAQVWFENLGGALQWRMRRISTWERRISSGYRSGAGRVISMETRTSTWCRRRMITRTGGSRVENDGKGNWTRHMIRDEGKEGNAQDFHSLAVADFDGDGDLDVYSGGDRSRRRKSSAANLGDTGKGGKWIEHRIAGQAVSRGGSGG